MKKVVAALLVVIAMLPAKQEPATLTPSEIPGEPEWMHVSGQIGAESLVNLYIPSEPDRSELWETDGIRATKVDVIPDHWPKRSGGIGHAVQFTHANTTLVWSVWPYKKSHRACGRDYTWDEWTFDGETDGSVEDFLGNDFDLMFGSRPYLEGGLFHVRDKGREGLWRKGDHGTSLVAPGNAFALAVQDSMVWFTMTESDSSRGVYAYDGLHVRQLWEGSFDNFGDGNLSGWPLETITTEGVSFVDISMGRSSAVLALRHDGVTVLKEIYLEVSTVHTDNWVYFSSYEGISRTNGTIIENVLEESSHIVRIMSDGQSLYYVTDPSPYHENSVIGIYRIAGGSRELVYSGVESSVRFHPSDRYQVVAINRAAYLLTGGELVRLVTGPFEVDGWVGNRLIGKVEDQRFALTINDAFFDRMQGPGGTIEVDVATSLSPANDLLAVRVVVGSDGNQKARVYDLLGGLVSLVLIDGR